MKTLKQINRVNIGRVAHKILTFHVLFCMGVKLALTQRKEHTCIAQNEMPKANSWERSSSTKVNITLSQSRTPPPFMESKIHYHSHMSPPWSLSRAT